MLLEFTKIFKKDVKLVTAPRLPHLDGDVCKVTLKAICS